MLPCCVEEAEVLGIDGVFGGHVAEEDGADEGEGEGEEASAGQQQQGPDIPIGKSDVVILDNSPYSVQRRRRLKKLTVLMVLL